MKRALMLICIFNLLFSGLIICIQEGSNDDSYIEQTGNANDAYVHQLGNMNESDVLIEKENVQVKKEDQKLILLAEDNEMNIMTIKDYLEVKQFRVVVARNGNEAVEMAHEINPELILMDIQMPKMNGLEAIKEIRATNISDAPIIALTALVMPNDKEKCLNTGADEYLKKPVGLKNLVKTINELLVKKNKT